MNLSAPRQSDTQLKQSCSYKLPLYSSCANSSPARLRLQRDGGVTALEADTPRLLGDLQSCRSRILVHGHLQTYWGSSQAHKPVSPTVYTSLRSRLTRVTPAHSGNSSLTAGLKPPGERHFITILVLGLYPIQHFSLNQFAGGMWAAGTSHSAPDQSRCPVLQAATGMGRQRVLAEETCSDSSQKLDGLVRSSP